MKITPDVNPIGIRPGGSVLPRSSSENRTAVSDEKVAQDVIAKIQRDKSLADALAIAQSSREMVQKAITISMRLMSLASEAMVTGRVNMDELATHMSSINGSMGNFGERVSVTVSGGQMPVKETVVNIDDQLKNLGSKTMDMIEGKKVESREFEPVVENLRAAASEIDAKIKRYSGELGVSGAAINFGADYSALNSKTAASIVGSPGSALAAQGNINYDMAGRVTMA